MQYNFVVFSLFPWNSPSGNNIKDMSFELAKHHNVLYVDLPLKRKEKWFLKNKPFVQEVSERLRSGQNLKKVASNLWHYIPSEVLESVNSVTSNKLFDALNYINNKRFTKSLRKAIHDIGFTDYILINDNDIYNGILIKQMLNPPLYVYYLRDNLSAFSYWKRHVTRLEPQLIKSADLVITNSEYLADYAGKYNSHSYYVGQGCDVTHYLQKPKREEVDAVLSGIPKPIVGYIGALNSERLDVELIRETAVRMPDLSFVLVGPEDDTFKASKLHDLKNVYFLGNKSFNELPKYVHGFEVAINPQALNEITIGNYPRKVDEYLAAGLPVVATKTHAMKPFAEHVYLGENVEEYCALIKLAINENSDIKTAQRIAFANTHTWTNNIEEFMKVLEKVK